MDAAVKITDVIPDAVTVQVQEIQAGDFVFTTFGEPIRVSKVRALKSGRMIITRSDGWSDIWEADESITIRKGA